MSEIKPFQTILYATNLGTHMRPVFRQGPLRTVNFLQPPYAGLASKMLDVMLWRNR